MVSYTKEEMTTLLGIRLGVFTDVKKPKKGMNLCLGIRYWSGVMWKHFIRRSYNPLKKSHCVKISGFKTHDRAGKSPVPFIKLGQLFKGKEFDLNDEFGSRDREYKRSDTG